MFLRSNYFLRNALFTLFLGLLLPFFYSFGNCQTVVESVMEQRKIHFEYIKTSEDVGQIRLSYGYLLCLLEQGLTDKMFSFELRSVLMERLTTSDIALHETFTQLMRSLNQFQKKYVVSEINTLIKETSENALADEERIDELFALAILFSGNFDGMEEIIQETKSFLHRYIQDPDTDLKGIDNLAEALTSFIDETGAIDKDQMISTTMDKVLLIAPQNQDINNMIEELKKMISSSNFEVLRTMLIKISNDIKDIQSQSESKLEKIATLYKKIEEIPTQQVSCDDIRNKILQIRSFSQNNILVALGKKQNLEIKKDLIESDSLIFN